MLTTERCRELVTEFRELAESKYGIRWPELQPPVRPAELEEVEQQIGLVIPADIKALYGVCRAADPLISFALISPEQIGEVTSGTSMVMNDFAEQGLLTRDPWDESGRFWIGRNPPEGEYVVFGKAGNGDVVIETDGPLQGRVMFIDASASGDYTWATLASSVESFLDLQIELVKSDVYEFAQYRNSTASHAHRGVGVVGDGDIVVNAAAPDEDSSPAEFELFVAKVAAINSRYGGTQAMHLYDYDLPGRR